MEVKSGEHFIGFYKTVKDPILEDHISCAVENFESNVIRKMYSKFPNSNLKKFVQGI